MPTGSGKTVIFTEFINRAIKAKPSVKILILLNRVNLLLQTEDRVGREIGKDKIGVYCGSLNRKDIDSQVIISTIQSISKKKIEGLNLCIIDETHALDHEDGRYSDFLKAHETTKIIGFTATPFRSTGAIYGENQLFSRICYKKTMSEMIEGGYLVTPRMKKVEHQHDLSGLRIKMGEYSQKDVEKLTSDKKKIKDQVIDALARMTDRNCIVWACASIQHSEDVAEQLKELGESVSFLHSKQTKEEADKAKADFESHKVRHMCFVSIISEGYDFAPIDCVVLMRPIRSPVLYIQIVGRALRPFAGKEDALVLDYGRVVETLGPLDRPLIAKKAKGAKKAIEIAMKFCKDCLEYCEINARNCPVCNYEFFKPVDKTKNLDRTASFGHDILAGSKEKEMAVRSVSLRFHKSKNGNECVVVQFFAKDVLFGSIDEYFVYDNEYAYKRLIKRLATLGVDLKGSAQAQSLEKVKIVPNAISYVEEDRYPRIKRLIFS